MTWAFVVLAPKMTSVVRKCSQMWDATSGVHTDGLHCAQRSARGPASGRTWPGWRSSWSSTSSPIRFRISRNWPSRNGFGRLDQRRQGPAGLLPRL